MEECANCYYKIYCERAYKYYPVSPCDIVLPDQKYLQAAIDSITEDLHAQYDE